MKLSEVLKRQAELKEKGKAPPTEPSAVSSGSGRKSIIKVLRARETPNPNARQYVLNAVILDRGSRSYNAKADGKGDLLAERLFEMRGVRSVFIMDNFVTVTKDEAVDWNPFGDQVWNTIARHAAYYESEAKEKPAALDVENFMSLSREEKMQAIEMVLNRSIRSNLARDGGGVELKGLEGSVIHIHYEGACGSCPTSLTGTLQYIEKLVKQQLHNDLTVKPV
ncbi:MAG: NifU family protein [Nitrospinales bacterium]